MKVFSNPRQRTGHRRGGFSLIEVLIGISILAVAILSLAQVFLMAVLNNVRSGEITNSVFLAQQQIDYLRTLTRDELMTFPEPMRGESDDELIDTNVDGTVDYRRLTSVVFQDPQFDIRILVFPGIKSNTQPADLLANPIGHKMKANIHTVIAR
ncbi:MAG: prepilin-type N-terminal cleavage/methylation domain-containing protein [Candidatus Aminicenantales bacterium]